jgi:hypothetical protein
MAGEALLKTPALPGVGGTPQIDRGVTTPDIWSTKLNIHLYERTFLKEITNNDWENEAKGPGDTIFIREMPDIPIHRTVPGEPRKRDRVRYKSIALKLDKTAGFDLEFDDIEALQSDMKLKTDFLNGASKNMDEYMCADVVQTVYASAGIVFQLDTPDPEEFHQAYIKALMLLGKNKVNIEDTSQLWSLASYDAFYLLGIGPQTKADEMGVGAKSTYLTGRPSTDVGGVRTFFSNQMAVVGGRTQILIGHRKAITWAMQMDKKVETLRNPEYQGDIIRGQVLYGFEVVKPEMLVCIDILWGSV